MSEYGEREPCAFCGEYDCAPDDQAEHVKVIPASARRNPDATFEVDRYVYQRYVHESGRHRATTLLLYAPGMMITPAEAVRVGLNQPGGDITLPADMYDESRFWDSGT